MNEKEMQQKLVDLYAGSELPQELEETLTAAAFLDKDLNHDMATLRHTVNLIQGVELPEFTEESYQRILMKLYSKSGADVQPTVSAPTHMQYFLPIAG